jgi:hypothetical protein
MSHLEYILAYIPFWRSGRLRYLENRRAVTHDAQDYYEEIGVGPSLNKLYP